MPPPQNTTTHYFNPPPSPHSSNNGSIPTKWGPYTSAADFDANVAMILVILVCALVLAVSLNVAIRYILHRRRRGRSSSLPTTNVSDQYKPKTASAESPPTLVFTEGTKLAGAVAECAICLSEFVEGDGVRVIPACNHGFHVKCIEKWLSSKPSCPTCRASCCSKLPPEP